jgi:CubicO group peptidase (beta-lactamase class C family)
MHASPDLPAIDPILREAMTRYHVPGVAIGWFLGDAEHVAGFGITNVEQPLPVDGDTLFQIGSITKTVTGTAVMRLVEMGRLDLDTPVRAYLPDLRLSDESVAARVTLRHLLTHTGGWLGDYFDDFGNGDDALRRMVEAMADLPQLTPLGQVWSYNNAGFYLAGRLIEVASGKSYEAAARELVLDPLGLSHSFFFPGEIITYRVAAGHSVTGERPELIRRWPLPRTASPVGGLISSVRDLLRYAKFHLGRGQAHDGSPVLSPDSLRQMQSPQVRGELDDSWGVSWGLRDLDGARLARHGGATAGFKASLTLVPAQQFALAILTNASTGDTLHGEITDWVLRHSLGLRIPGPAPLLLSEAEMSPYLGRYTSALSDIELRVEGGHLMVAMLPKGGFPVKDAPAPPPPPPARAAFIGPDRVVILDGLMKGRQGEFLRRNDGTIAWLRSSRIHARQA